MCYYGNGGLFVGFLTFAKRLLISAYNTYRFYYHTETDTYLQFIVYSDKAYVLTNCIVIVEKDIYELFKQLYSMTLNSLFSPLEGPVQFSNAR